MGGTLMMTVPSRETRLRRDPIRLHTVLGPGLVWRCSWPRKQSLWIPFVAFHLDENLGLHTKKVNFVVEISIWSHQSSPVLPCRCLWKKGRQRGLFSETYSRRRLCFLCPSAEEGVSGNGVNGFLLQSWQLGGGSCCGGEKTGTLGQEL